MKRVLYFSNIQVPYRVRFFNELAKQCDLTVCYRTRGRESRDRAWANSETPHFRILYGPAAITLLGARPSGFDAVIIGCYTEPDQILAMLLLKRLGKSYFINLDGAPFLHGNGWKSRCKRCLLSGAQGYLTAGEQAAEALRSLAGKKPVSVYCFSSLTEEELRSHRELSRSPKRDGRILVVGQYFPYKGLDVALKAAEMDPSRRYLFVGMGSRTNRLRREHRIPENVELIPFLQKRELEALYQSCALLVLPSRRECWGLVVNEAASFGMPIVSTWGSGAAVEFLGQAYPQYLAEPGDPEDLLRCVHACLASGETEAYSRYLLERSRDFHIQQNVQAHARAISGSDD